MEKEKLTDKEQEVLILSVLSDPNGRRVQLTKENPTVEVSEEVAGMLEKLPYVNKS